MLNNDPGQCNAVVNGIAPTFDIPLSEVASLDYQLTGATEKEGMDDASGTAFGVGQTNVSYTIEDVNGNMDQCSFTITITDNENPQITCTPPAAPIPNIEGACNGRLLSDITPVATDNCEIANLVFNVSGATTGSGFFIQGFTFNEGTSVVTYTATDLAGNTASCSIEVTVEDQEAPAISCPNDTTILVPMGALSGLSNEIDPSGSDNCGIDSLFYQFSGATTGEGAFSASGNSFSVGTTTVQYTIEDVNGNANSCSFNIIVEEAAISDLIDCPSDIITANNAFECEFTAMNIAPNLLVDPSMISFLEFELFGSLNGTGIGDASGNFPVGVTTVQYIATSTLGFKDTCVFSITVEDIQPPSWTNCLDTIRQGTAPGLCGANVFWLNPIPSDNCGIVNLMTSHSTGDFFNEPFTTVTYTAYDAAGNEGTCSFVVEIVDVEDPVISNCPSDFTYTPLPDCKAQVFWDSPIATDNCSVVTLSTSLTSGSVVDVGQEITVLYLAVDGNGNDASCTFTIEAPDVDPPTVLGCPNNAVIQSQSGSCAIPYNWTVPTAIDECSGFTVTSSHNPGNLFPVGTTTVTYTFTDDWGNSSNCSFEVMVADMDGPDIECAQDVSIRLDGTIVSDPSGFITNVETTNDCNGIKLTFSNPQAQDLCSGIVGTTQSSGIASGETFPLGNNPIIFIAQDLEGNTSDCQVNINVLPIATPNVTVIGGDIKCQNDDAVFVAEAIAGANYFWQGPGGWTATGSNPTRPNVQPNHSGLYAMTVVSASGCSATQPFTIFVNPSPDIDTDDAISICSDGNSDIFLNVTQEVNAEQVENWTWTGPCDFQSDQPNPVLESLSPDCSGTYTVTGTALNGCSDQSIIEVEVINLESPQIQNDCEATICLGESCTLFATEFLPIPEQYNWLASPTADAGLPGDTDDNEITITPTKEGTYVYRYWVVSEGCNSDTASIIINVVGSPDVTDDTFDVLFETQIENFNVVFNDSFNVNANFTIQNLNQTSNGVVENNNDGTFDYTPDEGFLGTDQFIYEVCYDCDGEVCETGIVSLFVKVFDFECEVPSVITPNGDGINDELFVNCIESNEYPNNEMRIFNQWGDEVLFESPYLNDWQATFEGRDLPDGTYFYLFKRDPSEDALRGWITVFR